MDHGFDYLITMTDRLGADICLVATRSNLTANAFAGIFFEHWYCNNGLPLEIISDRDRLFTNHFWQKLHKLSGVKLKMLTAYHPQTDSSSKCTNKTIIQMLCFFVDRQQKGWVKALPRVRFELMSSVNKSTGFSPFQLLYGRAPRLLPPLPLSPNTTDNTSSAPSSFNAHCMLRQLGLDCWEAQDNLTLAKVCQAIQANRH
jgi:transposase InsO family protein